MMTEDSTRMTPTDRSMPAVRITRVWAIATIPVTVTCCNTSDMVPAVRKRGAMMPKAMTLMSSTIAGMVVG